MAFNIALLQFHVKILNIKFSNINLIMTLKQIRLNTWKIEYSLYF